MSTFRYPLEVGNLDGSRFEPLEPLVDIGASYTFVPRDILARLGIAPEEERQFILANGEEHAYPMAWARVRLDGHEHPTPVIFGDEGSEPLLGPVTLEEFGLSVDALNQRLVPTPGYLVGIRDISELSG